MSADSQGKAAADEQAGRVTPGEHLRAEIQRLGLDQVAVSKATGVSRQSVNNIINGRQAISRAMAGKLGRLTGRSSDYWLSEFFSNSGKTQQTTDARRAGVLVNHQIIRAVEDGIIGISPFAPANVRAAAIDLTAGKGLTLAPGGTVTAQTKERIELPLDYLGRIGAASRLASLGIIATHALQIEPGFKGRLNFCLFNAGGTTFRLRAGEPAINLEIVRLNATADLTIST
jgi:addiction module HigA family antidote